MAAIPPHAPELEEDPVYRHARHEASFVLGMWACCFFYTITYCYLHGYLTHEPNPSATGPAVGALVGPLESFDRDPASLRSPLGIPDWVFYGIALPWVLCIVLSFWFCLSFFKEDDLEAGSDGESHD